MEGHKSSEPIYVLGNQPDELARLDRQAASIDRPTRLLLQAAGLTPGSRVLDLGTGLGHVAQIAGELVGPTGSVLGIDRSADAIAVARRRASEAGARQLTYEEGDAREWRAAEPFDAIVGRLLLFHVPDPTAVVRHHLRNLRPGGEFVAIDFDLGGTRAEPSVPIVDDALRWVEEAFRAAGAWPRIGARLGTILERGGLSRVSTFGIQPYVGPQDPMGPRSSPVSCAAWRRRLSVTASPPPSRWTSRPSSSGSSKRCGRPTRWSLCPRSSARGVLAGRVVARAVSSIR